MRNFLPLSSSYNWLNWLTQPGWQVFCLLSAARGWTGREESQAGRLLTGKEELLPPLLQLQIAELIYAARLAGIRVSIYPPCLLSAVRGWTGREESQAGRLLAGEEVGLPRRTRRHFHCLETRQLTWAATVLRIRDVLVRSWSVTNGSGSSSESCYFSSMTFKKATKN